MPHREFKSYPTQDFINKIIVQIEAQGRPEDIEELFHLRIDKSEVFEICAHIKVDGRKRGKGDLISCPMCSPNRFLDGRLCWFPRLHVCAFIGHCCADKATSEDAVARFNYKRQRDADENFLLPALLLVPEKLQALHGFQSACEEATRLHRLMRQSKLCLPRILASVVRLHGTLAISEVISKRAIEGGPRGMRTSQSGLETIDVHLGVLDGLTALSSKYEPIKDLNIIRQRLLPYCIGSDEENVLYFVADLNDSQRKSACIIVRQCDRDFLKLESRLSDFRKFFEPDNIKRLQQWTSHPNCPCQLQVSEREMYNHRRIEFTAGGQSVALSPKRELWSQIDWPRN